MGAGEEIDLTGLDKQIIETQRHIEELNKSVGKFGNSLTSLEHKELGQKLHSLSSSVNELFSAIANTKGIENSVGAMKSLTEAMEVLNKAMTATKNASTLFKTGFVEGEIGAASGMIESLMKRLADGITKSSGLMSKSSVSFVKNLQAEFNKILKEAPPKIAKLDVFDAKQTLKDLESVRARSSELKEYLRALGEELKKVQSGGSTAIKNLPQEMGRTKKEIQEAERAETSLLESIGKAVENQNNFNNSLIQCSEYYSKVKTLYDEIVARMELMQRTSGNDKEIKKLENWKKALEIVIKPYEEFISGSERQTSAIDAATKALSTQAKYSTELANTTRELAEKRKDLAEWEVSSKSSKTALETEKQRIEVIGKLVEKYTQLKEMSEAGGVKQEALKPMMESVMELENKLKELQEQLNAIYKADPMAQKVVNASVMGTLQTVMDKNGNISQELMGADENAVKLLNTFNKLVIELGSATGLISKMSLQAQKDAAFEESRFSLERQKLEVLERRKKQQAALNKLVAEGNAKGIRSYLQQGATTDKLQNVLNGIRNAMANVNIETEEGKKKLKELKAGYEVINNEIKGTTSFSEKLNSVISKSKNLVSQVAMSFGVMGGVFGATNFVKSLYKITSEFQLQQKALGAIVNNAREANILFRQMQSLAVSSPLKFMDLNRYAKQLAAYRIETNKLYDSLKMLGDISVGVGVDMDRLILAYGQVKAANYLRGQELRQFSEAGVNILGGLRDYYAETKKIYMSINDIFDSVSKRKVLFEDVDAVLHRMTQSGGAFYNMQLIQSQTLYGQIRKLSDMFQIEMNRIGDSTSGLLLGSVKAMQFVLKNLGQILRMTVAIGSSVGIYKLYTHFKSLQKAADSYGRELTGLYKIMDIFSKRGIKGFKQLSKYLVSIVKNINLTKLAISAAAGVAAWGLSKVIQHVQETKEKAKETAEELVELNRRLVEIRKVERRFSSFDSYDKKKAALQELVEKAKEFNYFMSLPANIDENNVDEVFKKLDENLKEYVKDVERYTAAFSNKRIDEQISKFGEKFPDFVMYSERSKQALDFIENNLGRLNKTQREAYDEIRQMQADFAQNEEEAVHKYGITTEMLDREIAKRTSTLLGLLNTNKFFYEGLTELFDDKKVFTKFQVFFSRYNKQISKIEDTIKKKAKGIDWNIFAGLEGDALKEKVEEVFPPLLEQFKDQAEFFGPEAAAAFARMFKIDEGLVIPILFDFQKGDTDLNDPEWQKEFKRVIDESGLQYDEKEKAYVLETKVKTKVQNLSGQYVDVIRNNKQVLSELNISAETSKEDFKKILKESIEDFKAKAKEYEQVKSGLIDFDLKNSLVGIRFATPDAGLSYFETLANKYTEIYEKAFGKLEDKTTHGRSQSMKSEYQSMIDFVRELNREFDALRKNFNEKDSAKWAGATNRILSSFEAKFGAMPAKFKDAFQKSLANIDFTTKEGTVQAENIVKGLIDSAKDLTKKEKKELQRAWGEAVGQIKLEAELELKAREDERLKAQVQKMFDDYNLTIELKKMQINVDEVTDLFGITKRNLSEIEQKLIDMREDFIGQNMEKEYRQYWRKLQEIQDKANLEMSKKYLKYLRNEYNERAKIELDYMKQRAEIYALPFDEDETMRILENLRKETDEKLAKIDWDEFRATDYYIEMFEDLETVSSRSINTMISKLDEMKSSLKGLSPTELKTMTEQIQKLKDELVDRNPFKALAESMKELRSMKTDANFTTLIAKYLGEGEDGDQKLRSFSRRVDRAIDIVEQKISENQSKINILEPLIDAAKTKQQDIESLNIPVDIDISQVNEKISQLDRQIERFSIGGDDIAENEYMQQRQQEVQKMIEERQLYAEILSMMQQIEESGAKIGVSSSMSVEELLELWKNLTNEVKTYTNDVGNIKKAQKELTKQQKALVKMSELFKQIAESSKQTFDNIMDNLDYLGGATDEVTDAWKDFGDAIFDTITGALGMIPTLVAGFTTAGLEINAAMGIIGLIAEAIQLVITLITALAKVHDARIEKKIQNIQKSCDKLKKTIDELTEAFENLYNEDRLREFDAAIIKSRELYIANLNAMIDAERQKKKVDQDQIDGWLDEIDDANKEMQEGIENFYEALGGFGSAANMKSTVEEWTDAWYEAFKETGDGLSGLEDSFEEFFENIVKKTLMNNIMAKYFGEEFLASLDTILGTEGGVMGNLDALNDWITQYHDLAVQADEEMQAATQAIQNVTGIGGNLEGLQASLQGMTEETADILAAYLNSVRFYVADNNQLLQNLLNGLTIDNNSNPMLQQLKIVAAQTTSINLLLDSVVHSGGYQGNGGGSYLKVHAILES